MKGLLGRWDELLSRRAPRRKKPSPRRKGALAGRIANLIVRSPSSLTLVPDSTDIDPPGRNLDRECGYPDNPSVETYDRLFRRNGVANRAVRVQADECWASYPDIYETKNNDVKTQWERAWAALNRRIPLCHYWHRADMLSGIGHYGALLMGLNDGGRLRDPVGYLNPKTGEVRRRKSQKDLTLSYLRPFGEVQAKILELEDDESSPRVGQPRLYQLSIGDPRSGINGTGMSVRNVVAHWSRVIHIADNRETSECSSLPILEPILNWVLDLRKVSGSAGEMFYKGGFPGISFETVPDLLGESVMDEESLKEQILEYMEGLRRYLALDGVTAKPILPMVADPTPHIVQLLGLICATLKVPLRIFLGSESGHLASTQDVGNWNRRVGGRQKLYLDPMVIRPTLDRLTAYGCLPAPARGDYYIDWQDLNTLSDKDRALVSLQKAQALMQYVSGKVETVLEHKDFLTLVMGMSQDEAEACVQAVERRKSLLTDPLGDGQAQRDAQLQIKVAKATPKPVSAGGGNGRQRSPRKPGAKPQGGGRRGNAPRGRVGRPAGKIAAA